MIPFFGWFGVIAAILFLTAAIIINLKKIIKPRLRISIHRKLAIVGLVFMIIHITLALRVYF